MFVLPEKRPQWITLDKTKDTVTILFDRIFSIKFLEPTIQIHQYSFTFLDHIKSVYFKKKFKNVVLLKRGFINVKYGNFYFDPFLPRYFKFLQT